MEFTTSQIIGAVIGAIVILLIGLFYKRIWRFLRQWEEPITLPISWAVFFFSSWLFWLVDPTAGTFDIAALQLLIFATCGVLWANGLTWLFIRRYYPTVYSFIQNIFDDDYNDKLTTWERIKFFLYYFAINFLGFILLVRAI